MPFAPSSVGDIIALVTLAAQIYQALDDAKGSSSQYRELAQQLKSFQTTLRVAESSLSRPDVVASEAALESINEEIRACRKLLDKFDEHVKAYRQALTRNRRSAVVAMRQIMWSLTKQKDIAELRQNLTQHSQTIVILMNVLILEATSAGSTDVKEIKVVSAEVLSLQKRIPAGITFDASSGNALSLIDAFGRKKTLTMEFFFSPEAFHETMLHHYSKTLAFDYIKKRHYVISTEDGKSIAKFEPNQWGAVVKKGAILVLSVEVKTPASQSRTCPTCHETDQGLMADDDWFEWQARSSMSVLFDID
ncbi:hypothetical protein HYPSUDRAFT_201040 [Hypholoma sublateritium FD-334 SS-4]|uniref:Uncharacterized protein n=1 Tax=Hypholoma sublateritium (strain FD-334 SS-4) TaxID=945553 RepID=A0A0D2L9K6_HYPSF|nr:hypothetical protein HYPSUDRAFT_201040 [Hypholoma sublateritium FD-334 SS-4]